MEDISVGQKAKRSIELTAEHVKTYAKMTGDVEVISVHGTKPVTQLKVVISRQDGETVLEGEAWRYTFRPETPHEK